MLQLGGSAQQAGFACYFLGGIMSIEVTSSKPASVAHGTFESNDKL
jgi:hypothetical protein